MYALRVQINEEPPVTAGSEDLGVLNAIVNAVGPLGTAAGRCRPGETPDLHLSVGGLTARGGGRTDEHLRWVSHRTLHTGDRVTIELVQVASADPPESNEAARQRENEEREYFEHSRRVYFELRGKYEPGG